MRLSSMVIFILCWSLAGAAAHGQASPDRTGEPSEPWDPRAALGQNLAVAGARQEKALPRDLVGEAATFPVGDPQHGLAALVYVPTYYDARRRWPVLVEGVGRGKLGRALREYKGQAERHGFILLGIEYLYFHGDASGEFNAWSRQGDVKVEVKSRGLDECLRDMTVDARNVQETLKDLSAKYAVEKKAVGISGFLGASIMAYRLPLQYPDLFCAGIARSGGFHEDFMPAVSPRAREIPFYVVFGEKEREETLRESEKAIAFLKKHRFKTVSAEKIPHSGVDSRPEIVGNCFRSTVDDTLGAERAQLDRAANLAGLCLGGALPSDILQPNGEPINDEAVLLLLESFATKYPQSGYLGRIKLPAARILIERLGQQERGEELLREFLQAPLAYDPMAPDALLYLAEKILDPEKDAAEVRQLLNRAVSHRSSPAPVVARARELLGTIIRRESRRE